MTFKAEKRRHSWKSLSYKLGKLLRFPWGGGVTTRMNTRRDPTFVDKETAPCANPMFVIVGVPHNCLSALFRCRCRKARCPIFWSILHGAQGEQ